MSDDLITRDLRHHWHPCSQMKDFESFPPLEIIGAEGCIVEIQGGKKLIDAISSWWCKSLGHGHPRLRAALIKQASHFEHVISANTVNPVLVELSEHLATLCPPLNKMFYAGDGSMAVEIALKLALHAQHIRGQANRTKFITLEYGYHGESGLALGVSDLGIYREPYDSIIPKPYVLRGLPTVSGLSDPLWNNMDSIWPLLENQLDVFAETSAALVIEPVLQGAGGMRLYSPDLLRKLRAWTKKQGIYFIADEILTGFWRTGKMLAMDYATVAPDLLCLSKGLTAGWLPFSAVLIHPEIHAMFYSDYGKGRDFLHSNTFSGNALGAAVALEALRIYSEPEFANQVTSLSSSLAKHWEQVVTATGVLQNSRQLGVMAAADLRIPKSKQDQRIGFQIFKESVTRGALLRNLGNTVYWLPPLTATPLVLEELAEITTNAILFVLKNGKFEPN